MFWSHVMLLAPLLFSLCLRNSWAWAWTVNCGMAPASQRQFSLWRWWQMQFAISLKLILRLNSTGVKVSLSLQPGTTLDMRYSVLLTLLRTQKLIIFKEFTFRFTESILFQGLATDTMTTSTPHWRLWTTPPLIAIHSNQNLPDTTPTFCSDDPMTCHPEFCIRIFLK